MSASSSWDKVQLSATFYFNRQGRIRGAGALADVRLLLYNMGLALHQVGTTFPVTQFVGDPDLNRRLTLQRLERRALGEITMVKVVLYVGQPPNGDALQIGRRIGCAVELVFKGKRLIRLGGMPQRAIVSSRPSG
jgi:hypothetical protein